MAKKRKTINYEDIDEFEEFIEEEKSCEDLCEEKAEDECEGEASDECEDEDDPELCEEEYIDECVPRKIGECVSECEYRRRGIDGNGCGASCVNHVLTKTQLMGRVGKIFDNCIKEIAPKSFIDKDPNILVKPMVNCIKEKLSGQMIEFRLGEMDIKKRTEQTEPLFTATRYTQEFFIPYKTPKGRDASLIAYLHVNAYYHESSSTGKNEINAYKSILPEITAKRL